MSSTRGVRLSAVEVVSLALGRRTREGFGLRLELWTAARTPPPSAAAAAVRLFSAAGGGVWSTVNMSATRARNRDAALCLPPVSRRGGGDAFRRCWKTLHFPLRRRESRGRTFRNAAHFLLLRTFGCRCVRRTHIRPAAPPAGSKSSTQVMGGHVAEAWGQSHAKTAPRLICSGFNGHVSAGGSRRHMIVTHTSSPPPQAGVSTLLGTRGRLHRCRCLPNLELGCLTRFFELHTEPPASVYVQEIYYYCGI